MLVRDVLRRYCYLLCGFLAVALAVIAQWCLRRGSPLEAGLLFAVAVSLAIYGLRRQPGPVAPPSFVEHLRRRRIVIYVGLVSVSLAVVLGLISLQSFASTDGSAVAWWLHLGSVLALLVGACLLDVRRGRAPGERPWTRVQVGLLLGILALAAVVRFWDLGGLPYGTWYDEAEDGLVALRILEEPGYLPVYEPRVNSAGHYLLMLAGSLRLLGSSTEAVRAVSALMGTTAVAVAYLVGRELFGRRLGLVAAFLLAVSRWSINFSRIGMHNVATPLFALLAVGFLLRGLRRRRYLDFALAGIGLGLGMVTYVGFLPFPLVLAAFLVHTALAERHILRRNWRGLVVLALALLLTIGPVAQYALREGEHFWERTGKASVFKGKTQDEALDAVAESTVKHLSMFNYRGDRYGRHNLSGAPMLDPISGALLVLGIGLCLWRWRRPRSLLLPLWLLAMLAPGILSLEWEAPHAVRTIGSLPAAYLLAVVPIHSLWGDWRVVFEKRRAAWFFLFVALLLALIGHFNLHTYFFVQARDFDTWRDFSTAETIAARVMAELGETVDLYVISYYHDHPVVRFLAPGVTGYQRIETHDDLPLPQWSGREAVMILDGASTHLFEEARTYYPLGSFTERASPFGGSPVVYVIRLSPEDISSIQGLMGYYRRGEDWSHPPSLVRQERQLSFDWSDGVPLGVPFLAEWRGVLRAPEYGEYRLVLRSPGHVELFLDGALLMQGEGGAHAEVSLAQGNHDLQIRAAGGDGHFELAWQPPGGEEQIVPPWALYIPPVTANGLLGSYFPNGDWQGPLTFARIDRRLGVYYHIAPLPMPHTVEWEGQILIPESGDYLFAIQSIDDSVLYIDGEEVVASLRRNEFDQTALPLEAGLHHLRVRHAARTDHMYISLYWTPPGGRREIIPPEVLIPPQDSWQLLASEAGAE